MRISDDKLPQCRIVLQWERVPYCSGAQQRRAVGECGQCHVVSLGSWTRTYVANSWKSKTQTTYRYGFCCIPGITWSHNPVIHAHIRTICRLFQAKPLPTGLAYSVYATFACECESLADMRACVLAWSSRSIGTVVRRVISLSDAFSVHEMPSLTIATDCPISPASAAVSVTIAHEVGLLN